MKDGSDAVSDWPLLNALINTASGATWVSLHHGGGVGMGFSQHAGVVIVADGSDEAARRLERVLWNDPASGVGVTPTRDTKPRSNARETTACGCRLSSETDQQVGFRLDPVSACDLGVVLEARYAPATGVARFAKPRPVKTIAVTLLPRPGSSWMHRSPW